MMRTLLIACVVLVGCQSADEPLEPIARPPEFPTGELQQRCIDLGEQPQLTSDDVKWLRTAALRPIELDGTLDEVDQLVVRRHALVIAADRMRETDMSDKDRDTLTRVIRSCLTDTNWRIRWRAVLATGEADIVADTRSQLERLANDRVEIVATAASELLASVE